MEKESKQVGKWNFCPDCFQRLLSQPPSHTSRNVETGQIELSSYFTVGRMENLCHLCGREIDLANVKKMGDWPICNSCYSELLPSREPSSEKNGPEQEEKSPPAEPIHPSILPGTSLGKKCEVCRKKLVEGGYYMVDEAPFCPDCYYNLVHLSAQTDPKKAVEEFVSLWTRQDVKKEKCAPEEKTQDPSEKECPCCLRSLPADSFRLIEGFFICHACQSTDLASALSIARASHKKWMERRKRQTEMDKE